MRSDCAILNCNYERSGLHEFCGRHKTLWDLAAFSMWTGSLKSWINMSGGVYLGNHENLPMAWSFVVDLSLEIEP